MERIHTGSGYGFGKADDLNQARVVEERSLGL
jgi:hypothetical protein